MMGQLGEALERPERVEVVAQDRDPHQSVPSAGTLGPPNAARSRRYDRRQSMSATPRPGWLARLLGHGEAVEPDPEEIVEAGSVSYTHLRAHATDSYLVC